MIHSQILRQITATAIQKVTIIIFEIKQHLRQDFNAIHVQNGMVNLEFGPQDQGKL